MDWCSHAAAKYAVETWHYSGSLPTPPLVKVGVWEDGQYIGCVLFSRGANQNIGNAYGLAMTSLCELTRIALKSGHTTPVTRVVRLAVAMMKKANPGLRLVVSFADPMQGHVGAIYQAGNWVYSGTSQPDRFYIDAAGRKWHSRQVSASGIKPQYGTPRRVPKIADCVRVDTLGKHRYLYPLDDAMRAQIAPLARPYPKRPQHQGDAAGDQPAEGGSIPTRTLQSSYVGPVCPQEAAV